MKILIITDIHYGNNVNYESLNGKDYINVFGEDFKEVYKKLEPLMLGSDLVVNLGDLIQDTNIEKDKILYKEALDLFKENNVKIEHVLGNHDLRNINHKEINNIIGRESEFYSFDLDGFHHVILSSTRDESLVNTEGYHRGKEQYYIEDKDLEWLKNDLNNTKLSTIVYSHYPLDEQDFSDNYYFKNLKESGRLQNRESVRKILEKSKKVKVVFSGHTHFYHKEIINNIEYFSIPSFSENDGEGKPNHLLALIKIDNNITVDLIKI
jgi:3',5'-cyclic AMP phosphodiesterase CpdA